VGRRGLEPRTRRLKARVAGAFAVSPRIVPDGPCPEWLVLGPSVLVIGVPQLGANAFGWRASRPMRRRARRCVGMRAVGEHPDQRCGRRVRSPGAGRSMPFVGASAGCPLSTRSGVRLSLAHAWYAVGIASDDGAVQEQRRPAPGTPASALITRLTLALTACPSTTSPGPTNSTPSDHPAPPSRHRALPRSPQASGGSIRPPLSPTRPP
jgi:hypothetical protein